MSGHLLLKKACLFLYNRKIDLIYCTGHRRHLLSPSKRKSPSSEDDYLANHFPPQTPIGKYDSVHHNSGAWTGIGLKAFYKPKDCELVLKYLFRLLYLIVTFKLIENWYIQTHTHTSINIFYSQKSKVIKPIFKN